MTEQIHHFKDITLLITHYNRSKSLEKLLSAFKKLNCQFAEIIVSDDGSQPAQLSAVEDLKVQYQFNLVSTPVNKGLGNNINKGQDQVKSRYTLYIQEDFTPKDSFPAHLAAAGEMMDQDDGLDLISFYAYERYPYSKPYRAGFSERTFKLAPWYTNNLKFYLYSDHPHLRRTTFFSKFGRYREGINGDKTEMDMSLSFIRHKGRSLVFDQHYDLLTQENSEEEPSTANFRKTIENNGSLPVVFAKWVYARFKFVKLNLQLLLKNNKK